MTAYDGVGVPAARYTARGAARARYGTTLGALVLGLGAAVVALGVVNTFVADDAIYSCPPDCGRPPNAVPVEALPRFVAPGELFSVSHPPPGSPYAVSVSDEGVTARMTTGDRGVLRLFGQPARGRDSRQVVEALLAQQFPGSVVDYELPNAAVGYQPGYGVVADFQPRGAPVRYDVRVIVLAAVKDDLALIAMAEGPFRRFSKDFGPGPPSGANLEVAITMGTYVESFAWRGDPPR